MHKYSITMKYLHTYPLWGLALVALILPAQAMVNIPYVNVGEAGNLADPATGYGAVGYDFRISKHEVTIGQYADFLNAKAQTDPYGLYNQSMGSDLNIAGISRSGSLGSYTYNVLGIADRPITYVSWYDAARFTNWLHNGQGNGDTENGAYTLTGNDGIVLKNSTATVWLPSEDEWYKAAYYDPTTGAGGGDNYWLHAQQSDTLADNTISANYYDGDYAVTQNSSYSSGQNYLRSVGSYGVASGSYYGTLDQGGNVFEWNDAVIDDLLRGLRGGSWGNLEDALLASTRDGIDPLYEDNGLGFRVAAAALVPVPEPSLSVLLLLGCGLLLRRHKA
jgi:formylglycine-generating enzyme